MAYDDSELRGIGGWLAFLIVVLAVFTPIRIVLETVGLYADPQIASAFGPRWPAVQAAEIAISAIAMIGAWFVAWRLNKVHNWQTIRIAIAGLWLLALGSTVLEYAAISLIGGIPIGALFEGSAMDVVRALVFASAWTAYLLRSRRVANTYSEPEEAIGDVFA